MLPTASVTSMKSIKADFQGQATSTSSTFNSLFLLRHFFLLGHVFILGHFFILGHVLGWNFFRFFSANLILWFHVRQQNILVDRII